MCFESHLEVTSARDIKKLQSYISPNSMNGLEADSPRTIFPSGDDDEPH